MGHDARERVLAHLATCPMCKTEADAQRRLKSVFAQAAPPPPSASFLARLQGLPGGGSGPSGRPGAPGDGEGFATGSTDSAGLPRSGVFGVRPDPFAEYVPAGAHAAVLPSEQQGFRIHGVTRHEVGRHEAERSLWRGRRFAFAAAGAVSLAAIALGGVTVGAPTGSNDTRAGGSGSNVTPQRTQGSGTAAVPESMRRRGGGNPLSVQGQRPGPLAAPLAPAEVTGPLLPGPPTQPLRPRGSMYELTAPMVAGAVTISPLIRPVPSGRRSAVPPGMGFPQTDEPVVASEANPVRTTAASPGAGPLKGTSQLH
ncbi:zf-HC2 domain-containing protein [Streptomyces sp. NPDC058284]|uniref:zf-HC2 domain-containing protein n=1 Tax=unclassified Streptomyces TaxID=2593676 RepID=UPI00365C9549